MNGLLFLAILTAGIAVVVAVRQAPNLLPWRARMRWLLVAQLSDPIFGFCDPLGLQMREVVLIAVEQHTDGLRLVVQDAGRRDVQPTALERDRPDATVVAALHDWCALRTPLLLVTRGDEETALHGPTIAVVGLRAVQRTPEPASPGPRSARRAELPNRDHDRR